jgi:branched-chain amino acid transport system substrate-binding protein
VADGENRGSAGGDAGAGRIAGHRNGTKNQREETVRTSRALGALVVVLGLSGAALAGEKSVKIGVLTDLTSFASTAMGPGSVLAGQLAVEHFGGKVLGKPIELISADMQSKPDLAVQIARRWYDAENVDLIVDVPASAAAIAIQAMATEKDKMFMATVAATPVLTLKGCSPNAIHWVNNTSSLARAPVSALMNNGAKTWFLIMPDFQLGKDLVAEATPLIEQRGGKVLDVIYFPTGSVDFTQYLLRAQASGADVIGTGGVGLDLSNLIKQAVEFNILPSSKQRLAAFVLNLSDVHAVGLQTMQGVYVMQEFYWDHNDQMRAFAKAFFAKFNRMPNFTHSSDYSGVTAYLKTVQDIGTDDPKKVVARMKEVGAPRWGETIKIRADGRALFDADLYQVKSPAESKYPWDYLKQVATISSDAMFPPADPSQCPLVK